MKVLVLNCGSSSLKFQVIETDLERMEKDEDRCLASGLAERVGGQALLTFRLAGAEPAKQVLPLRTHKAAIEHILAWVSENGAVLGPIEAVGHRVVHGGEAFKTSTLVDEKVLKGIEACIELAPLHNPANLKGIEAARALLGPAIPQTAVFDTAFHASMPEASFLYGLPYWVYRRHRVRRYGFHGTSHRYLAWRYRKLMGLPREKVNILTLHLGNGSSACAVKDGHSYNTTMGFTPLEGLVMGTRSGSIDPMLVEFLAAKEGLNLDQVGALLNKQSGLLGLSGMTDDMRELLAEEAESKDRRATLAIDIFCARVRQALGGLFADMGGADGVVFSGGIGAGSAEIRARICAGLGPLGLTLDPAKNAAATGGREGEVSAAGSRLKAFAIPTDEELLIARDTVRVVHGRPCPT